MILVQYLDYLHQAENSCRLCVILAVNNWESLDTEGTKMDVMGLV